MDAYINIKRYLHYRNKKAIVPPPKSQREPIPVTNSMPSSSLGNTISEGFAFSIGTILASNVVKKVTSVFSGDTVKCENTKCDTLKQKYDQCLKLNESCRDEIMEYEKCMRENNCIQ